MQLTMKESRSKKGGIGKGTNRAHKKNYLNTNYKAKVVNKTSK